MDPWPEPEGSLGIYVYGVLRSRVELSFGAIGLGVPPAVVGTMWEGELAAVVSAGPVGVPDPTRDNVLAHYRVQEAVMREHTLLPTAFGLTVSGRQEVVELLRSGHDAFLSVLAQLDGQIELGLKVLWDRDLMPQEAAEHDARTIVEALRPHATAVRVVSPIGERMILNAAFLVAREREAAFDAKMRSLAAQFELLTFQYTGPWAPYHFADIRLRRETDRTHLPPKPEAAEI
ncbi:GvpL/GvpF family gas vesicle protein [Hyalangium versicolor]|uniref:GvpL/GvpF family gas vesicle protein n=1 Tax=Hyalangium versicolor TaxID=2861190 RepID=UPI001CD02A2F|nr:GvpL/GvpF family gas vesicle protein [Hyalangium versicolor]